jgi:ribosomal RNA-processing protein 1
LKNAEWAEENLKQYQQALEKSILKVDRCPKGLIMHISDLYLEELSKISDGEISEDKVHLLLEPFMIYITKLNDPPLMDHLMKSIFHQLLEQSELGQDYEEKFDIWKQADFPTKSIHDIEIKYKYQKVNKINDDDLSDGEEDDAEERALDPRAGRVSVVLNEIKFDALKIAETFENLRYKAFATSKGRKMLAKLASK